jgi:hypothetical protein
MNRDVNHYLPFAPEYCELGEDGEFVAEWFLGGCRILLSTDKEGIYFCVVADYHGEILDVGEKDES